MAKAKTTSPATAAAHTKGPWSVGTREHLRAADIIDREFYVQTPKGEIVVLPVMGGDNEEQGANARLIAAAPELLDACRLAVISMKDAIGGNDPGWMDNMRADLDFIEVSIAKAYGNAA